MVVSSTLVPIGGERGVRTAAAEAEARGGLGLLDEEGAALGAVVTLDEGAGRLAVGGCSGTVGGLVAAADVVAAGGVAGPPFDMPMTTAPTPTSAMTGSANTQVDRFFSSRSTSRESRAAPRSVEAPATGSLKGLRAAMLNPLSYSVRAIPSSRT